MLVIHGEEKIPSGGILVIPNRLSFRELLYLEVLFKGGKVAYLLDKGMSYDPLLQARIAKEEELVIEFSTAEEEATAFKKKLHEHLSEGGVAVFVPGIAQVRVGQLLTIPSDVLRFLTSVGAPVLPMFVDHPEESCLPTENRVELERVVLSFGDLLQREAVNLANYTEHLMVASEVAFSNRPLLKSHLTWEILKGLKKTGKTAEIIDGNDGKTLRYDKLLAAGIVLAKVIRKTTDQPRVGIVLPPGIAGLLANLAVLLAGKVPVNLNFTAGERTLESCIEQAGLDKFITARMFMRKVPDFPWPDDDRLLLLERILPKKKGTIGLWFALSRLLPVGLLGKILKVSREGGSQEAVLLFTSGSSGDPKGVVLSHRNLLANVNQFSSRIGLHPHDKILGSLPLFHSFGSTVTLWYPMIDGISLVTYPNPLDTGKLAELIEKHSINLVLATPTFLRGYLRKATREQLSSLKLVITGAEKLTKSVAESFEEKFGHPVLEGYGLTETSPVTNVNLPDAELAEHAGSPALPNHRFGSVGLPMPGMAIRITDPETNEPLPIFQTGMIWFRGANVFEGYLNDEKRTAEVMKGGWFRTGDLGRLDEDGFLYIEGRLSRFSKIGGEMVPHETVEDLIIKTLEVPDETRSIAVMGVPDAAKGEALVLLSAIQELDMTELRKKLSEQGIPALWIPKKVVLLPEIPMLASGKLDLKKCKEVAGESS